MSDLITIEVTFTEGTLLLTGLLNLKIQLLQGQYDLPALDYACSDAWYDLLGKVVGGDRISGQQIEEEFLNRRPNYGPPPENHE